MVTILKAVYTCFRRCRRGTAGAIGAGDFEEDDWDGEDGFIDQNAKRQGYTVNSFVQDCLIPAEGYACRKPHHNPKRTEELRKLMQTLNKEMCEKISGQANGQQLESQAFSGQGAQKKDKNQKGPPPEAICKVRLTKTVIKGVKTGQAYDFMQESSLDVDVHGSLHFPPEAVPKEPLKPGEAPRNDPLDHRWHLDFEVKIKLERDTGNKDDQENSEAKLKVTAKELNIVEQEQKEEKDKSQKRGDAMVDSWLSKEEVLKDIELLLEVKLEMSVTSGDDGNRV